MGTKVDIVLSIVAAEDSGQKDFEYNKTDSITTLLENIGYRFKINDGVADYGLLPASPTLIDKACMIFIVADSDDLKLKISTSAGTGQNMNLMAGKPCLIQSNDDILGVFVSNSSGAPITGRFFAAGAE